MSDGIKQIIKKIYPILKRHDISRAAIFGSLARGEQRKGSDIDILIRFKGEKSLMDLAGLKIELEALLRREVDVLTYESLHPLIRKRILKEQKIIL